MPKQTQLPLFADARYSIREIHRAKLRQLRDEIAQDIERKKIKAQALRRAEDDEARWEIYRTKCVPLRGLR